MTKSGVLVGMVVGMNDIKFGSSRFFFFFFFENFFSSKKFFEKSEIFYRHVIKVLLLVHYIEFLIYFLNRLTRSSGRYDRLAVSTERIYTM
ncbi:hypothetical protein RclHR1_00190023 [Rhizophagus clarus]|uniref:Uncharacterized protein n=1 Tax=Rhizophagus clarus TaxID=94130 RepID=A0A2Z6QNI9_9GLOM|nr:hypothetical protein RclHR1_00190023 [Rhizophagus clarus]